MAWWRNHQRWYLNVIPEKSFPTFFCVLKDGKFPELTKMNINAADFNGVRKPWRAPNTHIQMCLMFKNSKTKKTKPQKWRIYSTELSKCLRSACPPTVYAHRNQSSWEQKHKTPWKPCRMLCPVPCDSEAVPTTAHSNLSAAHFSLLLPWVCLGGVRSPRLGLLLKHPVLSANCLGEHTEKD